MTNWQKLAGGVWWNFAGITNMVVQLNTNDALWYIYYSTDGGDNWRIYANGGYATQALGQTALDGFAAGLG